MYKLDASFIMSPLISCSKIRRSSSRRTEEDGQRTCEWRDHLDQGGSTIRNTKDHGKGKSTLLVEMRYSYRAVAG